MLKHLAIIMDGNSRWAAARGLPRAEGHRKGADAARETIETCAKLGIKHLTLYAFSSENWNRPEEEVTTLMQLLRFYVKKELSSLHKNNIKVRVIGDFARLDKDIQNDLRAAEELTKNNSLLEVNVALSYGSRDEIVNAAKTLAQSGKEITEESFGNSLYTAGTPDPDLLIRTGGEHRLSNFLLWQAAYAELLFTPVLWPDFGVEDIKNAISEFEKRERRYGTREAERNAS